MFKIVIFIIIFVGLTKSKKISKNQNIMSERPVIYFCFANQLDNHLDCLKKESRQIFRTLQTFHDKLIIEFIRDESVEIDELFEDMKNYGNRMQIFHYSGHADSDVLLLEDNAAHADGFAKLLETVAPSVQLVFLNGCSSYGHVKRLFEKKCKTVIATSCPIGDMKATEFSTKFYEGLAIGYSIETAFDFAASFVSTKYQIETQKTRGIGEANAKDKDVLPWGLYTNDAIDAAQTSSKWELPRYQHMEAPRVVDANYEVNQDIHQIVIEMAKFVPELSAFIQQPKRASWMQIPMNFPWTMSAQIRRLIANTPTMNNPSRERLKQIVEAYITTTRFLSFILLSQLFDTLQNYDADFDIDWDGLIAINKDNYEGFDYVVLMKRVYAVLNEMKIEPFVPDIAQSVDRLQEGGASFDAYRFLESIRWRILKNDIQDGEVKAICLQCETCLVELLKRAAFMVKYRLLTVKNISLVKPKYNVAEFKHTIGDLYVAARENLWEDNLPMATYTDSQSVLLVLRDEYESRRIQKILNLSPFIIDSIAFKGGQTIDIYNFAYIETDDAGTLKGIRYVSVENDPNKPNPEDNQWQGVDSQSEFFQSVYRLFEKFKNDLSKAALKNKKKKQEAVAG
jgi:hypothetical protein